MNTDIWKTPEEACAMLGADWFVGMGQIERRNSIGVVTATRRIYTGTEHPLAQAGKVVFTKGELK